MVQAGKDGDYMWISHTSTIVIVVYGMGENVINSGKNLILVENLHLLLLES